MTTKKRYYRQINVPEFGQKGQKLLMNIDLAIIGCGGLGTHLANVFTRLGSKKITLIDNDTVALSNLHRTALYNESDINVLKTDALKRHLLCINSSTKITTYATRLTSSNAEQILTNTSIILDASDNLPTRYLINELSIKHNIPWVYAGVHGIIGMIMAIKPGKTPCFSCLTYNKPILQKKEIPVFGTLPASIAMIQAIEAIKLLMNQTTGALLIYNIWTHELDHLQINKNDDCDLCHKHIYQILRK